MEQLDFNLYVNIVLGVIFGFAVLLGFMRGFKKSVYWLIVMVIYYTVFFLTLDLVVNAIYTYYTPQLGDILGGYLPELSEVVTLKDALETLIESRVPDEYVSILTRDDVRVLIGSVGFFVLKIIYTIFYFTVLKFLYKFICWIIRLIFIRVNKDAPKRRLLGGFVGAIRGAMAVYIFFIFVGGLINIAENVYKVAPEDVKMDEVDQFLEAYNNNIFVQGLDYVPSIDKDTPMHFYLFDKIFSLDVEYEIKPLPPQEQTLVFLSNGYHPPLKIINQNAQGVIKVDVQIAFRKEIAIFASVYEYYINSDYYKSNNLNQITGDDIRTVFGIISNSDLINTIIPIAIEAGMEYFETEITIPREELYEINWKQELLILGDLAATTFDLINMAGLLDSEQELETIPFTGEDVQQIFDGLAESELVTFAAYVALEPLLKQIGGEVQAIITVPKDIDWKTEFRAIGSIIAAIIDTDITVSELRNPEPTQLIQRLSILDFTIILNSKIIKGALINIFSGKVQIEGLDQIVIPEQVNWDEELQNILQAVNMIAAKVDKIDFNNLTLKVLAEFDEETIDKIFSSKILIATITKFINEMDFGETPVILSNTVYDEDGYIKKSELTSVVNTFKMLIEQLPCDEQDQTCTELGFNYKGILTLNDNHVKQLLSSTIITETVGYMLLQQAGDMLTVPDSVKEKVEVNEEELEVIVKEELERLFNAIIIFSFKNIENISFDETLINQLALENEDGSKKLDPEKSSKLFGPESSVIIHASLSKMILDVAKEENSPLIVPYFDIDNEQIRIVGEDGLEYIAKSELENILNALIVIDMTDFNDVENISIQTLLANTNTLLQSAIIHATVSDQIIKQESEDIIIPLSVRVNVGETDKSTVYVKKVEIENIVQTLDILDVENLDNFTGDFTLTNLYESEEDRETVLSSEIIHATISKQIVKIRKTSDEDASGIVVPDSLLTEVEETELERTITLVKKTEIDAVIQAFGVLKINNVNEFDGKVNLNDLAKRPEEQQKLFNSVIVHATVSDQVLKLHRDGNIVVPSVDETEKAVITIDEEDNFEYIDKEEIYTIIDALVILGFSDVESYDGKVNLGILKGEQNPDKDDVLKSAIIRATISREIIKLTDDGTIVVPIDDEEGNEIKHIVDGDIALIDRDEIAILIDAVTIFIEPNENNEYLIDNFSGKVNIRKLTRENSENKDTILSSAIIRATISDKILDLDEGSKEILVPIKDETGKEIVKPVKGVRFIIREEISTLIDALAIFGEDDIENFSGTVDLSKLTDEENLYDDITDKELILSSAILRATVSRELINLDSNGTIVVPEVDEEEKVVIISVDETDRIVNFVKHNELSILIDASTILGFTDVQNYNGKVDLIKLFGDENPDKETVLSSAILRATISDKIVELDGDEIVVPLKDDQDHSNKVIKRTIEGVDFIDKNEISTLIDALVILGFADVDNYTGNVDLSKLTDNDNLYDDRTDKEVILNSAILRATISREIIKLNGEDIVVPRKDESGNSIINTVNEGDKAIDFVKKNEISTLIDALVILGFNDVENYDGNVDLGKLKGDDNPDKETVLDSTILRATISKKITELSGEDIEIPDIDVDDKEIRITVPGETAEYIDRDEISILIDSIVIFIEPNEEGEYHINNFTDDIDLNKLTGANSANKTTVLKSAIIRATISNKIIELATNGHIVVPNIDLTDREIIINKGTIDFIIKDEISALIDALDVLGIYNIDSYEGQVDLHKLTGDNEGNQDIILGSVIIHATISNQIIGLHNDNDIIVPSKDWENKDIILPVDGVDFIRIDEVKNIINALPILNIYDVTSFAGTVELDYLFNSTINQDKLLKSAIIHASISKQLLNISDDPDTELEVPKYKGDEEETEIIIEVNTDSGLVKFVEKEEIKALINVLDVLGLHDIKHFSGNVALTDFYNNETNQNKLLASATVHRTISKQMLTNSDFRVPEKDINNNPIRKTVQGIQYVEKDEIKALINALELLNVTDVSTFEDSFTLDQLSNDTNKERLLSSATIHATLSNELFELAADGIIVVPNKSVENVKIQKTVQGTNFIVKDELMQVIDALIEMDYTSIDTIGNNINSQKFFDNRSILDSAIIHATISYKLLNETHDYLIIPDEYYGTSEPIRIMVEGVTFVDIDEINNILNALDALNLKDFSNIDLEPQNVFEVDFNILLNSASIQATLSREILANAEDENAPVGQEVLIIPQYYRQANLSAGTNTFTQIEKTELQRLLDALKSLSISEFNGIVDAQEITYNITRDTLETKLLVSGSIHVTIDRMLNGNEYISNKIPDKALEENELYGIADLVKTTEITNFILAAKEVEANDFIEAEFTFTQLQILNEEKVDTILDSMIVRNSITIEIRDIVGDYLFYYYFDDADFEDEDPSTFLTEAAIKHAISNLPI